MRPATLEQLSRRLEEGGGSLRPFIQPPGETVRKRHKEFRSCLYGGRKRPIGTPSTRRLERFRRSDPVRIPISQTVAEGSFREPNTRQGRGLFTPPNLYAPAQHIVPTLMTRAISEAALAALARRPMQDPASELRRIFLLRTRVNKDHH